MTAKKINPITMGVVGALAVAGVAGAMALSKKKNRKKVIRAIEDAKDKSLELKDQAEKHYKGIQKEVKKKAPEYAKEIGKVYENAKEKTGRVMFG